MPLLVLYSCLCPCELGGRSLVLKPGLFSCLALDEWERQDLEILMQPALFV